jgi:two-component system, cell cycle sensor histidine kinase and response regulator CckA
MVQQDSVVIEPVVDSGRKQLVRVLTLALVAGALVAGVSYVLRDKIEVPPLVLVGFLSFVGLYYILATLFGLLQHRAAAEVASLTEDATDALGDAVIVTDDKGRAVYANTAYKKLLKAADGRRMVGFDNLYAGQQEFANPIFQLVQAARKGETMHRDVRVPPGRAVAGASPTDARWLRLSISPMKREGHTLWRLSDITKDRQHQEQAFTRLQFIITYLDHAPAGFFSTLPNGKVDYINATLAGWLGIDLAESQGGKLDLQELLGADAARLLQSVVSGGETSRTEEFSIPVQTSNGVKLPVDVMHRVDFDGDGQPMPMRTMVLKRKFERKDADTEKAVQELVGAAPFGVAVLTRGGRVVSSNAAFLELAPSLKIGGLLRDSIKETDQAVQHAALAAADDFPGVVQNANASLIGEKPRAVAISFVKLPSVSDDVFAFVIDETESKALEVQLAQSQKMQAVGQLASGIAHDFNNVLTPIIGFADLLLGKMRPTDPSFADVMNIKQNAIRAANLVRQLLAFSRKQTMQPRIHSLSDTMSDLGNLLGRVLGEKTELKIVHGRDLGLVMVDIHQFEQVIINLAVNARDAMPNGGTLTVKTYNVSNEAARATEYTMPEAEYVACEVQDTGSGIPGDIVDKIWEPFFSTKDVGKGTGLGLSMVYGIIKQTGGFIFVDSVLGQGTTFRIYLPRHYPAAKLVEPIADTALPPAREDFTGKGRILVVEDEDSVRAFAMRALATRGYTVVEANTGEVALETILNDKEGFELILSDVVMPEMDGPTFLAEIRKRGIKTKFIFMSGYAEDAFERNLENPDDFAFLQKPFSLKQLAEKVKDVMAS